MAKPPREIYTICRLCLCDDEELLSPAIQIMDSSLSIQDIERFTGILLNADNMLNALCSECINKLRESVYFRNTCVSNDVVFKQLFEVLIVSTEPMCKTGGNVACLKTDPLEVADVLIPKNDTTIRENSSDKFADLHCGENKLNEPSDSMSNPVDQNVIPIQICSNDSPLHSVEEEDLSETFISTKVIEFEKVIEENFNNVTIHPPLAKICVKSKVSIEKVECSICEREVSDINDHMLTHMKDDKFVCPHCPTQMVQRHNLVRHIHAVHLKTIIKTCEICNKGFTSNNTYLSHLRSQHDIGETYSCKLCPKQFKYPSNLRDHVAKSHSTESKFECRTCGKRFKLRTQLSCHEKTHSTLKPYNCTICLKSYKSNNARRIHEKSHSNSKMSSNQTTLPKTNEKQDGSNSTTNEICSNNIDPINSAAYIKQKHKKKLCGICGVMVKSLGRHIQSHTNDARYTCPHCPIKMVERSNLLRHINAVHLKKVVKSCEICGKGFTHNNTYISHMRSHHGVGEIYECKLCPKQYKYPSNLRDHVKKAHVFECKFECSTCSKQFKSSYQLKTHQKVHSSEQPYSCRMCTKRFKTAYAKKTHELTHSGILFTCTLCDKSYKYKTLLNMHVRNTHQCNNLQNQDS